MRYANFSSVNMTETCSKTLTETVKFGVKLDYKKRSLNCTQTWLVNDLRKWDYYFQMFVKFWYGGLCHLIWDGTVCRLQAFSHKAKFH